MPETYDCGCQKRGGTAEIYTCPEAGFAHGFATEPFTCDGDHHAPVEAIKVTVAEVDVQLGTGGGLEELGRQGRREAEQQLETETHRLRVQLQDYRMRAVRAEQQLASRAVLTEEDRERLQLITDQIDDAIAKGQLPSASFWAWDARYLSALAKRGDNDDPEEATDGK